MKSAMKSLVLGSVMTSSLLAGGVAMADSPLTANAALTSNYLWRGMTQTDDGFAVQAGVDYAHESGLYVGAWASNVDFGTDANVEVDLYGGFSGEVGDFGYDVGYLMYKYPGENALNFEEAYLGGSYKMVSAKYYKGTGDWKDDYLDVSADFDLDVVSVGVHAGVAMPDVGDNSNDYSLSVSKTFEGFDVSAMVAKEKHTTDENTSFAVSVSKSFDLM